MLHLNKQNLLIARHRSKLRSLAPLKGWAKLPNFFDPHMPKIRTSALPNFAKLPKFGGNEKDEDSEESEVSAKDILHSACPNDAEGDKGALLSLHEHSTYAQEHGLRT